MYYSYVEIEYVATSFSPARMDLALKLLSIPSRFCTFSIGPDVPDYTACTNKNEQATIKVTHAINKKTQADIITMNTALANVFLKALSLQVHASFLQQRLCKPNNIFADMFVWFVDHYVKPAAKDCKANHQCMAADWHPANGFDTLVLHIFT
jgi:hypothetical protein